MLLQLFMLPDTAFPFKAGLDKLQFIYKSGRQHCKSHDLNKPDIFLFYMMNLTVRMEYTKGMLPTGSIVP